MSSLVLPYARQPEFQQLYNSTKVHPLSVRCRAQQSRRGNKDHTGQARTNNPRIGGGGGGGQGGSELDDGEAADRNRDGRTDQDWHQGHSGITDTQLKDEMRSYSS